MVVFCQCVFAYAHSKIKVILDQILLRVAEIGLLLLFREEDVNGLTLILIQHAVMYIYFSSPDFYMLTKCAERVVVILILSSRM